MVETRTGATSKDPSPSIEDKEDSEDVEGVGVECEYLIIYHIKDNKFDQILASGYAGGKSVEESTGLDLLLPLTEEKRMQDRDFELIRDTKFKARLFMRLERGK